MWGDRYEQLCQHRGYDQHDEEISFMGSNPHPNKSITILKPQNVWKYNQLKCKVTLNFSHNVPATEQWSAIAITSVLSIDMRAVSVKCLLFGIGRLSCIHEIIRGETRDDNPLGEFYKKGIWHWFTLFRDK